MNNDGKREGREGSEAKKKGWFSRRHETDEAYQKARATYLREHGRNARQWKADERRVTRNERTPQEQLDILDGRLGFGQGAQKERARLQVLIKD